MKVALIAATIPPFPCGVGKHTYCLASALCLCEHEVTFITLSGSADSTPRKFKLNRALKKFSIVEYFKWAKNNRGIFDIVHLEYPTKLNKRGISVVFLPWILRLYGNTTVLTLHELSSSSGFGKIRNMLLTLGFNSIILTNPDDKKYLKMLISKVSLVELGPTILVKPKVKKIIPKEMVFLGFMDGSKGEEDLLRALAMVGGEYKVKFLSRFDPEGNAHHRYLERLVAELNVEDSVQWFSSVSEQELSDNLASAEIVVLPFQNGVSRRNSTLIEALSYGKPTIVTSGPQFPNYLQDRKNCLIVEPGNVQELVTAIELLSADKSLRQALGKAALATMELYSWKNIAQQTLEVYRK